MLSRFRVGACVGFADLWVLGLNNSEDHARPSNLIEILTRVPFFCSFSEPERTGDPRTYSGWEVEGWRLWGLGFRVEALGCRV